MKKTYTYEELYAFARRADTEEKKAIAHKWLYDHMDNEEDYYFLVAVIYGLK